MSGTRSTSDEHPSWGRVEIRIKGHLPPRWSEWLDGLTLTCDADGTTLIEGPVVDQSALFGIIQRLRDLAVPLISIQHYDPANVCTRHTPPTPTGSASVPPTPRTQS